MASGHTIGLPSRRMTMKNRFLIVGAPKSQARSSRYSTMYPNPFTNRAASSLSSEMFRNSQHSASAGWFAGIPVVSMPTNARNVSPTRSGSGRISAASSGPQVLNSSTFSSVITRGSTSSPQRRVTHASPRIDFSTGLAPFALEKCRQSGESQTSPTRRPAVATFGLTS